MDYRTTSELLRLNRLEKQAQSYFEIGLARADLTRQVRAARLETAANSRLLKIMTREIEAFRPSLQGRDAGARNLARKSHFAAEALI